MIASDLRDLYQEVILDHGKNPRNFRHPDEVNKFAVGNNPMCGDRLTVFLKVDGDGIIRDAAFEGAGCAISVASASMMTEILRGKTADQAKRIFESFHAMCTEDDHDTVEADGVDPDDLDRLQVLSGVKEFPIRVKCATLAWHTMQAAMAGEKEISTE
ncbi:MAG: SUF system NifU family Fe-S cluster assembly protein [Rhodospirillales bacterium]